MAIRATGNALGHMSSLRLVWPEMVAEQARPAGNGRFACYLTGPRLAKTSVK